LAFRNEALMDHLKFNAAHIKASNEWYRFLSYGMVHADYLHLGVNMYVLYAFGKWVVYDFNWMFDQLANLMFVVLYFTALAVSVVPSYFKNKNNLFYNAVGASGAISAVVYVSIILNPLSSISFIFIPISFPAWIWGALYLIYSMIMSKKGNTLIGHSAHFWGAVYGLLFILVTKPQVYILFFDKLTKVN
jgi:membrane associated rhomboid family serine protease